jgi:CBS domain containing-hemolysin-like protein
MKGAYIFLIITFLCVVIEGFFSMFEMAVVSFNKVRLEYFVSQKNKRAIWLFYLLKKPSRLFGTTLIVVNTVLLIASESLRRFYESINLSTDLAPLTLTVVVVIFAELSPLFAARRHPEGIALFNARIIYFISKLFTPFTAFMDFISSFISREKKGKGKIFLTKEEIERIFEEKKMNVDRTVSNIFSLKNLKANQMMIPIFLVKMIPSNAKVSLIKKIFFKEYLPYVLVYHHNMRNIVSVVMIRDLLKATDDERTMDYGNSPWFVTENASILEILNQFKSNNPVVAIVLDKEGRAAGVITLDFILDQIFGVEGAKKEKRGKKVFVERTLSGKMLVSEFNRRFNADLKCEKGDTISDMINDVLEHHPSTGDIIHIENFEFVVKKPTLFGTKRVLVRNLK